MAGLPLIYIPQKLVEKDFKRNICHGQPFHIQQYTAQNTNPTKLEYVTDRIEGMLWEKRKLFSCIG